MASLRLRSLAVPDLAFVGAGFTFFFAILLFDGCRKLFRDSDTGWHIRNGESILSSGLLARVDPYSWSVPAGQWFAWEWGSDVLMGWAHRQDGLTGVALLYLVLIAACTWLWFRLQWASGSVFLLASLMAYPFLSTVNLHWLARPHVLGWVMLLVSILWLDRLQAGAGWRDALVACGLTALWANLHASFFLLPAIAMVYATAHFVRPLLWPVEAPPEHARAFSYVAVFGGAMAGTFLTPFGWRLHWYLAVYLSNWELQERIGEFQSLNFHSGAAGQILITLVLGATGAILALSQRKLAHFFLLAGFTILALRSARALPLLALLLPLAGGAITQALTEAVPNFRRGPGRWLKNALGYSANLRQLEAGFSGLAWAPVLALLGLALLHLPTFAPRTGFPPEEFPVLATARVVAALPADVRILAPDKFGGYLIYHFAGARKVFLDGRSDYYGVRFMRDYIELIQVRPGLERHLSRFGFTHALLPKGYPLLTVLPALGWREIYRDHTVVLLEAPSYVNERN